MKTIKISIKRTNFLRKMGFTNAYNIGTLKMASRTVCLDIPPTTDETPDMTKSISFSLTSWDKSLA